MTRLVFLGADGIARVDKIRPFKGQVECQDGNHPITNRSIIRSLDRKAPSMIIIWHGRVAPEGEPDPEMAKDAMIAESDYTKIHKQRPSVSKIWVRTLVRMLNVAVCAVIVGFGVFSWGFIIYAMLRVWTS